MSRPVASRPPCARSFNLRHALVSMVLVNLLLCASPAVAAQWNISGRVSYLDGAPAPFVFVWLRLPSSAQVAVRTDSDGDYAFSAIDPASSGSALVWAVDGISSSEPHPVMDHDVTQNLTLPTNSE